ncbi:MAG: phenol hydroxylase subunit P4 [Gammaproteobacteria bacterium]
MTVQSLNPGYRGEVRDAVENFNGMTLLFVYWEDHLLFCAPAALMVNPDDTPAALVEQLKEALAYDPIAAQLTLENIDWYRSLDYTSDERWPLDKDKTLAENGLTHKTAIRMQTPSLGEVLNIGKS